MRTQPYLILTMVLFTTFLNAQTTEELIAIRDAKAAELAIVEADLNALTGIRDSIKAEVDALTDLVTPYPRWDLGATGNLGLNASDYNDWLPKTDPNTNAFAFGLTVDANAHLDQKKFFWRNDLSLALGWQKFDNEDDPTDNPDLEVSADGFNISSLYGRKLSEKIALSGMGDYRTSLLEGSLNNPGYLDMGVGFTWTPAEKLVVVVHPLNFNLIFAKAGYDYQSSLGAKVVVDYVLDITKNIQYKSNLSSFTSYESSDYSNWIWRNGITTNSKGLGIGFDIALGSNKQEALAAGLTDNPLQVFWIAGITYSL